jgi:hypothetical protein
VSILWAYLQFRALMWLLRITGRLLLFAALLAVLVTAAPITLVTAVGLAGAWLRGWPPARLCRAAAWALPMTAVYLAGRAVQARTWQALALAPVRDYLAGWHTVAAGRVVTAFVLVAPAAVPAGLAVAGGLWAWRIYALDTGLSGKTASAPVVFDARQWKRQAYTARAPITAPGTVPLADRHGRVVMGATIRAVGHRWHPALAVPHTAMGRHQVVIGASGSGKTNLMIRTWVGWYAAACTAHHQQGAPRPLLVVLDCKGGPDSRAKADRTRRLLHAVGVARVAVWPDEASVSLWTLPPRELAVTLFQMVETGTGPAAYYADVMQAVLTLAITAPPVPPANGTAFLDRLEPGWLAAAYAGDPPRLAALASARRHLGDIALRYRTLLDRLGPALDHGSALTDADAWYFILEGTREQSVAEAQALALTELVAQAATAPDGWPNHDKRRREIAGQVVTLDLLGTLVPRRSGQVRADSGQSETRMRRRRKPLPLFSILTTSIRPIWLVVATCVPPSACWSRPTMSMIRTSLTSGGTRLVAVRMMSGMANASSLGRTRTSMRRPAATSVLQAASTASRKPGGTSGRLKSIRADSGSMFPPVTRAP